MAVLLIDNSFNLRINLGLIGELTGITDCHCFTDYPSALRFLKEHLSRIKVVFVNPNLCEEEFTTLMEMLKSSVDSGRMKVRVLYKPLRVNEVTIYNRLQFTGMPITRNEIELLRTL